MPPAINPPTIGLSSYTVSGSGHAVFYLDIDLDLGEVATFELLCPTAATVTLTEGIAAPIILLTSGTTPPNTNASRTVESSGAPSGGGSAIVSVTITAINPISGGWLVRVRGIVPPLTGTLTDTGNTLIRRVLADPTVNPTALNPVIEKAPIALNGTARYTTVPPGAGPMGTPLPPFMRARWSQQGPASISASPPIVTFSTTIAMPTLNANPAPFAAPGVYKDEQLTYRLVAFYDDNGNNAQDAGEPFTTADLALTVKPRTHHMLLVVDRSGSMLALMPGTTVTRWEFARRAAHVWADLWTAFRKDVGVSDKAGVMIFEAQDCGWTGMPAGPIDIALPAGSLGGISTLDVPTLNLGMPGACTPIGDALISAIDRFVGIGGTPDDRYVILLLTDGYENSGKIVVEDDSPVPAGATDTFDHQRGAGPRSAVSPLLAIYTAGLGSPGTVQESALQDLTDAPTDQGLYRLVQANQLIGTFGEMLGHALEAQPITPANPHDPFMVNANEHRLAVVLKWDNITDHIKLFRTPQGGTESQVAGPGAVAASGINYERRGNHGIVAVDLLAHFGGAVPASAWRVEYWKNGTTLTPILSGDLLVMVDLFVKAEIRFDRPHYVTGNRVLITCQLSAGGEPISGARVSVELARPGQGLGSFLASNSRGYKPPNSVGADPLAAKAAMLQHLLQHTEKPELPIITPPSIFYDGTNELWDDGYHRDGITGDGAYANLYTQLDKEGTYTWRFTISGKTPDGSLFSRVLTRAFWVRVGVDPRTSKVELNFNIGKPQDLRAVQIIVLPMDRQGELLGPFRASDVSITSEGGRFVEFNRDMRVNGVIYPQPDKGELLSHYDGHYSRILVYKKEERPLVLIKIQGRSFEKIVLP
jgi:hypothetical protein